VKTEQTRGNINRGRRVRHFLLAALPVLGLLALPSSALAGTPLFWSLPVSIDGTNRIDSLSCPSTTLCVAGDAYGNVLTSTDPAGGAGAWTSSNVDEGDFLLDFSCPSTSLCVGAGYDGNVVTSTNPTGGAAAWGLVHVVGAPFGVGLVGISCPSTTLCVASEQDGGIFHSSNPAAETWEGSGEIGTDGLSGLSCPTTSLCVAGDYAGHILSSTEPTGKAATWSSASVDSSNTITGLSCPSASFCVAVDGAEEGSVSNVLTSSNPTGGTAAWKLAAITDTGFRALSCPSVSFCVAADESNIWESEDPSAGAEAWTKTPGIEIVDAISCPSASFCVAVDGDGRVLIGTSEPQTPHSLTVAKIGSGTGTVVSTPTGIDCGTSCSHIFGGGTTVTLTATQNPGSLFEGWSGGGCTGVGICNVRIGADTSVTAKFAPEVEEEGGGGPGPAPVPSPSPAPSPIKHKKPHKCRKGFKKRKVHGKVRCVKVKQKHRQVQPD
jgi:hypothetical protein